MNKYISEVPGAPKAIGPYSVAVVSADLIFLSGQVPLSPDTGQIVSEDVSEQAKQVMSNLAAVLKASGASFSDVVKTTIFLTDLGSFATVNEIYAAALGDVKPARSTVQVSALPRGAKVEIEMIARVRN